MAFPAAQAATGRSSPAHRIPLRFTGSGGEYFRIWIVNLLLTLVTLSLYWPFARARRLVYFHNNTHIGSHALGFHADPWKMFKGYLLMLGLGGVYWGVSQFVPELSWAPFLLLAVLWPVLWRSSLMFRLRNTSWRGVRLDFQGSLRDAYAVMLSLFLPMFVLVVAGSVSLLPELAESHWVQTLMVVAGIVSLAFVLMLPWLVARVHAYQHSGYVFTAQRTTLLDSQLTAPLYWLGLKVIAMVVGIVAALVVAVAVVGGGLIGAQAFSMPFEDDNSATLLLFFVVMGMFYILLPLVVWPYIQTRLQNLLWGNTRSEQLTIHSSLKFREIFTLNLTNVLLIVLTLGLYWPFAAVRKARLRLQAVSLEVHGDVNTWVRQAPPPQAGVLGDAAGDFFGVDMGL